VVSIPPVPNAENVKKFFSQLWVQPLDKMLQRGIITQGKFFLEEKETLRNYEPSLTKKLTKYIFAHITCLT
jgi:hypothetical protein